MKPIHLLIVLVLGLVILFSGCANQPPTAGCQTTSDCPKDQICVEEECMAPPSCREEGDACSSNNDCCSGFVCEDYECSREISGDVEEEGENLVVVAVRGTADEGRKQVETLEITITAAAGAGKVNISQMTVTAIVGTSKITRIYPTKGFGDNTYALTEIRDSNDVFTPKTPIIDDSTLIQVTIRLDPDMFIEPAKTFRLEINAGRGKATIAEIMTPAEYRTRTLDLYP